MNDMKANDRIVVMGDPKAAQRLADTLNEQRGRTDVLCCPDLSWGRKERMRPDVVIRVTDYRERS